MPRVLVEYAAPAATGVSHIMGLSGEEYTGELEEKRRKALRRVGLAGGAAWVLGSLLELDALKNAGLGAAVASFFLHRAFRDGELP